MRSPQVQKFMFVHIVHQYAKDRLPFTLTMVEKFRIACGNPSWITEVEWDEDEDMGLAVSL